ncbi:MAG: hypothetical protein KJ709_00065 [Nanoarchaeota archaeon]|nr:hypothetical protein [Nanoarchaeota archaeon]
MEIDWVKAEERLLMVYSRIFDTIDLILERLRDDDFEDMGLLNRNRMQIDESLRRLYAISIFAQDRRPLKHAREIFDLMENYEDRDPDFYHWLREWRFRVSQIATSYDSRLVELVFGFEDYLDKESAYGPKKTEKDRAELKDRLLGLSGSEPSIMGFVAKNYLRLLDSRDYGLL